MNAAIDTYFKCSGRTDRLSAWKKILRWEASREQITRAANDPSLSGKKNTRAKGIATTLSREAEENIAEWVQELRSEGIPISKLLLKCKALEVASDVGLSTEQFKASPSWINGFIKRWKLSLRAKTRSGQQRLEEGEAALREFSDKINKIIDDEQIDEVYNAYQTGINYEYIPSHTINAQGEKTVWIRCSGHAKDRMTAMLLADTAGNKYPLFLILKTAESKCSTTVQDNLTRRQGFGPRVWPEIESLHERHPSRIFGNPTAWWNENISIEFLTYHFGHRRGKNMKKVILMWDAFSAHFSPRVVACAEALNVILEKIPPTFTWICQPADVA
ncbi:hypothetical protein LEN26_013774 [Aphanomyces euteiches]|nr:hypothetical protein LEN26_013774 [Aphanomyces euteiches]KAH9111032.1 hypothetical protein AeMF1_014342 [Aphanomyces euteiches]KAH9178952.1 hypothetical protein AeNC1_017395 [Aphanomyces euteiches]